MISSVLALLLVAAPDAVGQNREAYARCLKDFARASIEKKLEPAAFETELAAVCKDKEAVLKSALLKSDAAMGIKAAVSQKSTAEQIADYVAMAKEDYRFEFDSATKPKP